MPNISKAQARHFLLHKQLLTGKRVKGPKAIEQVFQKLRIIQYDPLNPFGRNPDLVLQARIDGYHPEMYYDWLYKEHKGIECYDKVLCIVPIEDFSLTAHNRTVIAEWPQFKKLLKDRKHDFDDLLTFIDQTGPVSSKDIENQEHVPGMGWYGYGSRWGKVALELLWKTGKIVIANRINGHKYYDLPHKVYGDTYDHGDDTIRSEHILRRVRSVGLIRAYGTTDAWRGMGSAKERNALVKKLVQKGSLTEIQIESMPKQYFVCTKDLPLMDTVDPLCTDMTFIAPLDMLIWDRDMIEHLFDFRYRWEVYTPTAKREFGYYVLPVLYKDQFVGRIEPKLTNGALEIVNFWKEPGVIWNKHMQNRLDDAVERFRAYVRM